MELNDSNQFSKKISKAFSKPGPEPAAGALLQCILQNTNDLVFAMDADGAILSFSRSVDEILGYREEIKGQHLKELTGDPGKFERIIENLYEAGMVHCPDILFRHAEGRPVFCDLSVIALENAKGKLEGAVAIARDITEWKKYQEELIRVDRLAEVGRNASGIVHDINNPLAVINEISGWMGVVISDAKGLNDDDRAELKTSVSKLMEQATRCRNIASQLLGFVRDSGSSGDSFDLHGLLRNSVSFLFPELKSKDVEVLFDFMEGPLQIRSEPRMLEQVFVNLLTNAIHAIDEKGEGAGHIRISTRVDETSAVVSFADTGIGIAPKDQKKIYELFYTTKPSGKGTGLGLPICRNIVHKLGGDIHLESSYWKGATFVVRIPIGAQEQL